jgi:hypothetical protein
MTNILYFLAANDYSRTRSSGSLEAGKRLLFSGSREKTKN